MVALTLTPAKGNAGARWFPHSGHLGLTPVKLDGIIRTRLEEDGKSATASAVTISLRCYEARHGRVGVLKTNILAEHTQTLWSPTGAEFGPLGELDLPFRLVIPVNTPGSSNFHLQEYRVYWRLEAAIHTPHIPGIGNRQVKCFDVNLMRYNKPSASQRPVAASSLQPSQQFVESEIQFPRRPVAPLDPVPVSIRIQPHTGVSIQRVTFALERHIDFIDSTPASSTSHLASPSSMLTRSISRESSPGLEPFSSTAALLSSPSDQSRSSSSRKRSTSPVSQSAKSIEAVLNTVEAIDVPQSEKERFSQRTLSAMLQVPLPKSGAHWGTGETMQGGLARVRFFVTAKAQLATGGNPVTVDLCQEELVVIPVDDAERQRVHSKYSMKRPATSPSTENQQEPRRPVPHLPSPPPSPNNLSVPSARFSKAGKRPHTSSGARDSSQRRALPLRPRSRGNEVTTPVPTAFEPEQFRAWERELDRIAPISQQRPRSSSALRIFASKKHRSPEPPSREDFLVGVARTVTVPSVRTAEVLEWEAEVERFSSASAREAVLRGRHVRTPLSV
ncbi:hypothetical protein RSOLAG1IB_00880 [Rhizoctonia solani AG-1 IB]|uniref:Arrestin C-terminal-like domain-containing protein n=2 Tax=Rhizoctonia solani TaxID=456999 RepID=M5BIC6_THACB|nr:unnamed protein product [Rhizoctonia solani]CCO26134.1 hypothetical protein BN14_00151 [Rhizoctonia solani AG-1 IB]CEL52340.1 hypothetical protein RSOLAG1IB_00880 [Rhizoctonia solani AG-1 IB]